jgi:hypothetical protein
METASTPQPPHSSAFRRCLRAVFGRKGLFTFIALITAIALVYAVENFRGQRAWERYRKGAEARGVKLDFAAHIPPPIPDAENGALTPWVQSWFPRPAPEDGYWPDLKPRAEKLVRTRKSDGKRHLTDLVAWKEALQIAATNTSQTPTEKIPVAEREPAERAAAAGAVLDALKIYQPTLDELRAASTKTRVRYPVEYKLDEPFSILLPHLAKIKATVSLLALQSSAELAAGKSDDAFKDVHLMLWLTESMREEPFLINQLVRIAALQITAHTIWEGLAQHQWSDAQLQALQARLAQLDFLSSIEMSLGAERAGGLTAIDYARRRGDWSMFYDNESGTGAPSPTMARGGAVLVPRGWFRMEAANYGQIFETQQEGVVDLQKRTVDAGRMEANSRAIDEIFGKKSYVALYLEHRIFARILLPALKNATRRFAAGQVAADEMAIACALERFRLANGKVPDTLEALAPKFIAKLPHDTLTGKPFKYERVGETDFVLSSVGWPETEADRAKARRIEWIWRSAP